MFHWPASRLPVRFFADTGGGLPFTVDRAVAIWEGQFLYGEFRGVRVDDSAKADVIVRWSGAVPPDVPPDPGPPVPACAGSTSNAAVIFGDSLGNVLYVDLSIRTTYSDAQIAACVRRVAIHELGHALGVLQESDSTTDIMNTQVLVPLPSERDRRSVEVLYHTRPTVAPPPR